MDPYFPDSRTFGSYWDSDAWQPTRAPQGVVADAYVHSPPSASFSDTVTYISVAWLWPY